MKNIISSFSIAFTLIAVACNAQQPTMQMHMANGKVVLLLDSSDASRAIVKDDRDGFFEKVTASEMSIQMKQPLNPKQSRADLLPEYIQFLKSDVADFTETDLKFMSAVLEKMYKTVAEVNPAILPDTLKLIKTHGRHYGDGVWYTRENCIIIPRNELNSRKTTPFTSTMYHELFHVYSRLNSAKSAQLYQLIGFQAIGLENLEMPGSLADRTLFNPDGVDFAQKIDLIQEDKSTISAIPVLYSNHLGYTEGNNEFFGYVEFNLFQIEKTEAGKYRVLVKEDGVSSKIHVESQPGFFAQIKDNTGYIIHPDEVLADNFSFIMQELNGIKVTLKFSAAGKELIKNMEAVLKSK
jgi:hypothetical protein